MDAQLSEFQIPRGVRLSAEHCLEIASRYLRITELELTPTVTFLGLLCRCVSEGELVSKRPAPNAPPPLAPVSTFSVAKRLGSPYETTRRHVQKLVSAGLCESVDSGVIVPQAVLTSRAFEQMRDECWTATRTLHRGIAALGVPVPDWSDEGRDKARITVSRLTVPYFIDGVRTLSSALELELATCLVLLSIDRANGKPLRRIRGRQTAPAAASVYEVSKSLGVPYETVRRHAATLVDKGMVARTETGRLAVTPDNLRTPAIVEATRQTFRHTLDYVTAAALATQG